MSSDLSELGLEALIVKQMTSSAGGWTQGDPHDFDRAYAVDLAQLTAFLRATQPEIAETLALNEDSPIRRKFLVRLQGAIAKSGVVAVLRSGIKHGPHAIDCSIVPRRQATLARRSYLGRTGSQ